LFRKGVARLAVEREGGKSMETTLDVRALFKLSYGLYIVGATWERKCNGQIANAVMQITAEPICVTTCLHRNNLTTEFIRKSGVFSVSVLEQDVPMPFIGNFGFKCGRDIDKFCNVQYRPAPLGSPFILDWTVAVLEAKVIAVQEVHTHVLFVGEVASAEVVKEGNPLTYADYHRLKKGKSHKNSPTSVFNDVKGL
jgi:flavin reductase (DIM6/NTAB) family NADH-FMN oxidoreductase RutF